MFGEEGKPFQSMTKSQLENGAKTLDVLVAILYCGLGASRIALKLENEKCEYKKASFNPNLFQRSFHYSTSVTARDSRRMSSSFCISSSRSLGAAIMMTQER